MQYNTSDSSIARLIGRSDDFPGQTENIFYQGCSFSPDGLCVLTSTSHDSKLRLYNTILSSNNENETTTTTTTTTTKVQTWNMALVARGGDTVRSYAWFPHMKSTDPATCCFLASCRDQPVHLFDAYTGVIRATYRPYNGLDEMESPTVVEFAPNGQHIWTGGFRTDRFIHVFDLAVPGRDSTILRLGKTRRSSDGQKGLVSAITGSHDCRIFCVGTYAPGSIYVYDHRASQQPSGTILNGVAVVGHGRAHSRKKRRFAAMSSPEFSETTTTSEATTAQENNDDNVPVASIFSQARIKWFQSRAQGGITQLQFSPNNHYYLYSASRRSDAVLSWDLRMMSGNPDYQSEPIRGIKSFATIANTNQRLEFDLDGPNNRLFVGGLDHSIKCYNMQTGELVGTIGGCGAGRSDDDNNRMFSDQAVNGVSFHPGFGCGKGLLAAATGSRQFPSEEDLDKDTVTCTNASPGQLFLFELSNVNGQD